MLVVLSPYHLTTREPAASAALLLASRVVTLLPGPDESARAAAVRTTRFAALIESWRWSLPLWEEDVLASAFEDEDPAADVEAARLAFEQDERFEPLRTLVGLPGVATLDAVAHDLLRAGADPGLALPVAAGLDAFAARHELIAVRAEAKSMAQQAEERMGEPVCRCALPVLLQAEAERLIEARETLAGPLESVRSAVEACAAGDADEDDLRSAADAYAHRFDVERDELTRVDDPDDPRVVPASVVLSVARVPADAVFAASTATAARVARRRSVLASPHAPVKTLTTMTVRVLGRRAR